MALEVIKAEEIWYPVVWEEIKNASNVIDYNINQEQTKDASSITNANNQTTTWLATVVPWINAPKLKSETSIIWWWGGVRSTTATCSMSSTVQANEYTQFDTVTLSWATGISNSGWYLTFSNKWTYLISIFYNSNNVNSTNNSLYLRRNHNGTNTYICDYAGLPKSDTKICTADIEPWDTVRAVFESNHSCNPTAEIRFIKL